MVFESTENSVGVKENIAQKKPAETIVQQV